MDLVMLATSARSDSHLLHGTALRRAEEAACGLLVVHVLSGLDYERQPSWMRQAVRDEMKWILHAMVAPAGGASGASMGRVTVDVREGDIVDQLIEAIEANRPDLVVLGEPGPDIAGGLHGEDHARFIQHLKHNSVAVERVPSR